MKNIIITLALFCSLSLQAQNIVGYWYGTANVKNGSSANNYLVELILKQDKTNVHGVINYYFRNTFRSFKLNGNYNSSSRQLNAYNIPVTYFASTGVMEVDCAMDLNATLRVAKTGSNLNGKFIGKPAYRNVCPEIFFDLKLNKDLDQDSILLALRQFKETYQVWRPSGADTLISATIINRPVTNYVVTNQFKEREKEVSSEIMVESDSLQVDFYDNGEVDGDSISIFYNDKLIAFNRILSAKAIHFTVGLDTTREVNEITMFADNLGSIPPNTALMLVYDGKKRYETRLTSTLRKNASVLIRRKKAPNP
jgi:hypothetical protein